MFVSTWAVLFTGGTLKSEAADRMWNAGTAGFADASRWTGTAIPGAADNAFVSNGGTAQIGTSDPVWAVGDLRAAETAGSTGGYSQSGGTVNAGGWMRLGFGAAATGNYTLSGGVLNMNNRMYLGAKDGSQTSGGNGVLTITGGTINQATQYVTIGARSEFGHGNTTGLVNQSGGTFNATGEFYIGNGNLGAGTLAGTYQLSGTGRLNVGNWLVLGRGGASGVMNMSGGFFTKSGSGNSVILGIGSTGRGTINQSGGVFTNTVSPTWFGEGGDGAGGTWTLSGDAEAFLGKVYLAHSATSFGEFNLNAGTLGVTHFDPALSDPAGTLASVINFNGGTLKARANEPNFLPASVTRAEIRAGGAVIDSNGFDITLDRGLSSNGTGGGLVKKGSGTMLLTGTSNFSGNTSVIAGTLMLNGAINSTAPTATEYHDTIGKFSCSALTLSGAGKMKSEIHSATKLNDRVIVAGAVNLGGSTLDVTDLGNVALPVGTTFKMIEYSGALSGVFSNAADGSLITVGVNTFRVKYNDSSALTLSIPGVSFESWAAENIANADDRDLLDDPDHDGNVNLLEFALDGDPTAVGNQKMSAGMSGVPGGGSAMSLTVPVRVGGVFSASGPVVSQPLDGLIYTVEGSTDLQTFGTLQVKILESVVPGNRPDLSAGWEYRSFQIVSSGQPHPREFMRVRVTTSSSNL